MSKIYKRTDRVKLKIDNIEVVIAPLSVQQKAEVQAKMIQGIHEQSQGKHVESHKSQQDGVILLLKHGLKSIHGIKNHDDSEYKLVMENDMVSDESIDDIFNLEMHVKLVNVLSSLVKGIPAVFTDVNGNKIEGVEFVEDEKTGSKNPN